MKFKPQPMVRWFNMRLLAATGLKALISSLFGNFADKREMQAVLSTNEEFDFSESETLWVDYVSDLGDGFNSTYTIAHLLAQKNLEWNGEKLERGRLLIMGGDQVYPTPEVEEYDNRLKGPYNAAYPWDDNDAGRPRLFAIPGNHDWYDGLSNFMKLFCQKRALGNWHTMQSRSYFAIQLPHRYWIFGIDIQLHSDIDEPQKAYFKEIAKTKLRDNDKIILCTAEPAWVYQSLNKKNISFKRLQYFEREIIENHKDLTVIAILTGDLHHYSHYIQTDKTGNHTCSLITAGGGGAFLHPTHTLKDNMLQTDEQPYTAHLKSVFPSKGESRKIAFNNLLFPFLNWGMALVIGFIFLLTAWFLQSGSSNLPNKSLMVKLSESNFALSGVGDVTALFGKAIVHSPSVVVICLMLLAGIFFFTDVKTGKGKWNYIAGFVHGILHLLLLYKLIWLFSRLNLHHFGMQVDSFLQVLLFAFEIIVIGGLLSGFLFGLYLLLSTLLLKNHANESFSSIRQTGYKNFLRMRIDRTGVTIYPIGIRKVVTDWKKKGPEDKPYFEGSFTAYEIIEDPIHLKK